jgi:small-conductance mechanosensitive channel
LSDVFSGIAMGLEHAYKPGDSLWVEGGIEGQVVQISGSDSLPVQPG